MVNLMETQNTMKEFIDQNQNVEGRSEAQSGKQLHIDVQYMLAEYFLTNEMKKDEWKNILLVVGRRKRGANGVLGNFTTAVNMMNDKKLQLFIESHLIDNQDIVQIEDVLRKAGIKLA